MTNESQERQAIEKAVQTYLDGLYEGDAEKLARVFHPTSALTGDPAASSPSCRATSGSRR